ncbi:MAG: hypothetical protein AMJ81_12310, partial [Phycisphaerae bacterium SM23_33]
NPGTEGAPFATLTRAREAVRGLRAGGRPPGPVTVFVREGVYHLAETLTLTAEDSGTSDAPVIYRAYPGETVELLGGRPIKGFVPHDGDVLKADVGAQGFDGVHFRQLFFDGRRMEPARYPNRNPDDPHGGAWAYVDGERIGMYAVSPGAEDAEGDFWQKNVPELKRSFRVRLGDARPWSRPEEGEVSIFPRFNWSHHVLPIEGFDPATRTMRVGEGVFWEIRPGDRYAVRGLREELDAPGEWFLDREARTLYFYPPEPLNDHPVYAPVLPHVVYLNGCSNVTVRGFTIACSAERAVFVNEATDCLVAGNTIRNSGGHWWWGGVTVRGGSGNGIVGNDIHDIATNGVHLSGGDLEALTPGGNYVRNNYIHHVGCVHRYSSAIRFYGVGNSATRNLIHDVPGAGVVLQGAQHTLAGNHIRHVCLEAEDTGGISASAIDWLSCHGTVVQHNFVHDVLGYGYDTSKGEWVSPYFTWALYPDWAASGMRITGNILARAPRGGLHLHSGRDNLVEGNVIVDCGGNQIECNGWTTTTGFWATKVDEWVGKYEVARRHEAWREEPTMKDPRSVILPDGHVMHGNRFRGNILRYDDPHAAAFRFHDVPLDRNPSDHNLIYACGRPVRTGRSVLLSEHGPNLLQNSGTEEGPVGAWPTGWGWHGNPGEQTRVHVAEEGAHTGARCLLTDPGPPETVAGATEPLYVAPGWVPFEPGSTYRFSAWVRSERPSANLALSVYSWKKEAHHWQVTESVSVTDEWRQVETVVRVPTADDPAYRPTMARLWVRLDLPTDAGRFWVDDVSLREADLSDEWTGWRLLGQDANSVVADPLFVDPAGDDYRLRPESPAFDLGFEPIPVDEIGPYADDLRATWPILEAPGAREQLTRRW